MYKNYMSKRINLKNFSLKNIGLAEYVISFGCPLDLMIEDIIQINTVTKVLIKFLNSGNKELSWDDSFENDSYWYSFLLNRHTFKSMHPIRELIHLYIFAVLFTMHVPQLNNLLGQDYFLVNLAIFYLMFIDFNYILHHFRFYL